MEYEFIIGHRYRELAATLRRIAAGNLTQTSKAELIKAAEVYERIAYTLLESDAAERRQAKRAA